MNMAICRFYAQGHCRYGDRCWNEHPANASQGYGQQQWSQGSGRGYRGSSNQQWSDQRHDDGGGRRKVGFVPSMQNRYSPLDQSSSTSQHAPSVDRQQILETVKKDMEEWLQSGMWMFSSYGFSKSQKSLAGLEDTSPEELRYFTYEAREAGKWNQYSQVITQSVLEVTKRRNDLKFPDAAIKTKIIQVYIGNTNIRTVFSSPLSTHAILSGSDGIQAENTISTSSTPLGSASQATSLFGSQGTFETNTTIFGNQSATSTLFGNQPAATTNTVFGNQPAATTSTLFGNQPAATTNTLFGNQPAATTSTLFGNQPAATTSTLFGNQPAATNNNVFGNQPAATTSTLFGNQPAATNNNVFGNQPAATTSTLFGNQPAATTSTLFENQPAATTNTVFGNQPAAASSTIFGNPPASGSSVFGSTASISQTPGLFGNPPQTAEFVTSTASDSLYTNISDLTDAERGQFESKTFTLGRIPVRPPPREMI